MKVKRSVEIAAPPEKVWPFLVEPDNILKWCITFKKFKYTTEQRSGVGTPFYVEEKAGGPLMKLKFAVTEWVENEKFVFKMTSGTSVKSYEQRWTLEPTPSGSTFTFMEEVELPFGIIGKLIGAVIRRSSEAHVKQMLTALKSLAGA
jgi:uncharacterized protein YndB with AHSA1/START domain